MKVIYKITYPNGKIYIGKDLTNTLTYFGSVKSKILEKEFSKKQKRKFIIKKEVIWESKTATDSQVCKKEVELIRKYRSNNPNIGYNRWPKFQAT